MHRVGPLGALAAPARAGEQVAADEAEQRARRRRGSARSRSPPPCAPRWATIRTSTPGGVARIRRCGSGSRRRAEAARRLRLADHDVGAAALADDPRGGGDEVVVLLDQQGRAEHRGELAQRRHLALHLALDRLARRLHPEQVEVGAEPLRRAPGAAHQALRAGLRADQREQPLADRLRRLGGDPLLARVPSGSTSLQGEPLGLDLLGDLAQADLAQRRQVLDPEEVVERGLDVLAGVDLAGAQARDQRLRGEVDQDDLVGACRAPSRGPSRAPAPRSARRPGR